MTASRELLRAAERGDPTAWRRLWREDDEGARSLAAGRLVRSMKASPGERLWSVALPDAFGRQEGLRLNAFSPMLQGGDVFGRWRTPLRIFAVCERVLGDKRSLDDLFRQPGGVSRRVTEAGEVHGDTLDAGWEDDRLRSSAGWASRAAWRHTSRAAALRRLVEELHAAYGDAASERSIPRVRRIATDLGLPATLARLSDDDLLRIADRVSVAR